MNTPRISSSDTGKRGDRDAEKMEKEAEGKEHHDDDDDDGAAAMDDTAASSWRWFFTDTHPCSLLQYVVRACASCLMDLCGGSGRGDRRRPGTDTKDATDDGDDPAAASQRVAIAEGGSKEVHDRVGARLLAARRRPPPGRPGGPRQGRGGSGGSHN